MKPALLNDQARTAFKLDDVVGTTDYCQSFRIATAGSKTEVQIRGPPVQVSSVASR